MKKAQIGIRQMKAHLRIESGIRDTPEDAASEVRERLKQKRWTAKTVIHS